jgi:hypothetical protein
MVGKAKDVESARDEVVSVLCPLEVQLQLHGLSTANQELLWYSRTVIDRTGRK